MTLQFKKNNRGGHNSDGYRSARLTDKQRIEFLELMGFDRMKRPALVKIGEQLCITSSQVYKLLLKFIKDGKIITADDLNDGRALNYYQVHIKGACR